MLLSENEGVQRALFSLLPPLHPQELLWRNTTPRKIWNLVQKAAVSGKYLQSVQRLTFEQVQYNLSYTKIPKCCIEGDSSSICFF